MGTTNIWLVGVLGFIDREMTVVAAIFSEALETEHSGGFSWV